MMASYQDRVDHILKILADGEAHVYADLKLPQDKDSSEIGKVVRDLIETGEVVRCGTRRSKNPHGDGRPAIEVRRA